MNLPLSVLSVVSAILRSVSRPLRQMAALRPAVPTPYPVPITHPAPVPHLQPLFLANHISAAGEAHPMRDSGNSKNRSNITLSVVSERPTKEQLVKLYEEHYASLVRLASFLLDDVESCEEVVQDAFVKLYTTAQPTPGKEAAYLRAMVLNGTRSRMRWRRVRKRHVPEMPGQPKTPDNSQEYTKIQQPRMPTDNQDRQDQPQPIENRLRKALHEHAQQVSPSSEAFFTINQRISRREAASAWSPRVLWEKRERLRLQPSLVLSLVLLVALSVVTTLLLTRDTDATQTVQVAAPSSTESPTTPEQPDNNGTEPTPTPTTVATTPGNDDPDTNNPNLGGDEPVKVVTDESEPPDTPTPSSTTVAPPTTTNPPTPTTAAPPDTTTTTAPPETDPPPPERPSETLFEVRPLQVARNGYPVVYAEHRLDSERLSTIPVVPEDGPYKTTLNTAVDNDGTLWVEVLDPEGNAGWVLSHTVSVQPHLLTSEETTMFGGLAQVLVNFVGAVDEAMKLRALLRHPALPHRQLCRD